MDADDRVMRIKSLLGALPGVHVAWVDTAIPPGHARFGLAISNPRTLSRLVHLACSINVPLVTEIDWGCQAEDSHDDPSCIRYDLRVPMTPPQEDDPGDLEIVAQVLTRELDRLGLTVPDE